MERVIGHFWVGDQLYEADYDKAVRHDGRADVLKVHKSERRCACPDREALERLRRVGQVEGASVARTIRPTEGVGRQGR